MTIESLYRQALKKTREAKKEESAIMLLLMHSAKLNKTELYIKMNEELNEKEELEFINNVDKYLYENKPVQYIMGYENFYGREFLVNEGCLIPRCETEELVENVLKRYKILFNREVDVVDIGTGSGCIAITLAKEEPNMKVVATDISTKALEIAKKNAQRLGANVEFLQGNMLEPLENRKFDILVSNPPYIPDDGLVDSFVKDNEPNIALFGGCDGMDYYKIILQDVKRILNKKYLIAFEHAFNQRDLMMNLIEEYLPNSNVEFLKDMQGRDRMTLIYEE